MKQDFGVATASPSIPVPRTGGGIVNMEQNRAIAEAQGAILVAQKCPRDEERSFTLIIAACNRKSMAESSMYGFKRGTSLLEGPTIRLAETMARLWGNITYGMRELSRNQDGSEVEAFAWDLQSNVRVTRQFVVRHQRDTKSGPKTLSSERDVYEMVANMGQRRVRACLLEIIPADVVEGAINACKKCLENGDGKPLVDRARDMLVAFRELGVSQKMIEGFLQHSVSAIVPAQLVRLTQIYRSISDGVAPREDFFDVSEDDINKKFENGPAAATDLPVAEPHKEATVSVPDTGTAREPQSPTPRTRPKTIEKFKEEIQQVETAANMRTWLLKHKNRVLSLLPKVGDQKVVLFYADQRLKSLTQKEEREGFGEELKAQRGGEKNNNNRDRAEQQANILGSITCPDGKGVVNETFCNQACPARSGCPEFDAEDADAHGQDSRSTGSKLSFDM